MLVYLLAAIAGVLVGKDKDLSYEDIIQTAFGVFLAFIVSGIAALALGAITVQGLIGTGFIGSMVASSGVFGVIFAPIIAGILGAFLFVLVAIPTKFVVDMKF